MCVQANASENVPAYEKYNSEKIQNIKILLNSAIGLFSIAM
jgi:hypothetical protein